MLVQLWKPESTLTAPAIPQPAPLTGDDRDWIRRFAAIRRPAIATMVVPSIAAWVWTYWLDPSVRATVWVGILGVSALLLAIFAVQWPYPFALAPLALGLATVVAGLMIDGVPPFASVWYPANLTAVVGCVTLLRHTTPRSLGISISLAIVLPRVAVLIADRVNGGTIEARRLIELVPQLSHNLTTIIAVAALSALLPEFVRVVQDRLRASETRSQESPDQRRRYWQAEARRWAHDQVLYALHLISNSQTANRVRRAATSASLRLSPPTLAPADLVGRLTAIRSDDLQINWCSPRQLLVPPAIAEAFVGSVDELVRNIEKHAGVDSAIIHLHRSLWSVGGVRVIVSDRGRGFDPRTVCPRRIGLAESVVGPMVKIGGKVKVDSAPGAGATVRLTWRPKFASRADGFLGLIPAETAQRVLFVSAILPVINIITYLCLIPRLERPLMGLAGALLLAVGTVLLASVAARSAGPLVTLASTALSVASISFGAASIASPEPIDPSLLMMPTAAGGPLAIVMIVRPLREGIAASVITAIAGIMILGGIGVPPAGGWPGFIAPLYGATVGLVLGLGFDLLRNELTQATQAELRTAEGACESAGLHCAARELIESSDPTIPFLLARAAAGSELSSAERALAASAEQTLRDRLVLGEAPRTLSAARVLRQAGWMCSVQLPIDPPAAVDTAAAKLLAEVAAGATTARPSEAVTVSAIPATGGYALHRVIRAGDRTHYDELYVGLTTSQPHPQEASFHASAPGENCQTAHHRGT